MSLTYLEIFTFTRLCSRLPLYVSTQPSPLSALHHLHLFPPSAPNKESGSPVAARPAAAAYVYMAVDAGSTGGAACLATIMTEDRVLAFHRLAASWPWPISVAYLSTEWHRDRRLGLQLLDVQAQPPPDAHRIVLSVVADRGYRCARRQPRLPRSVRPIRSLSYG